MAKYKFNLIPPKTKEELIVLEERENSILYSAVLIFATVFIFFVLNLLDIFIIGGRISLLENNVKALDSAIAANSEPHSKFGELILKGNLLEPILIKDIKIDKLFTAVDEIIDKTKVKNYGREQTGEFTISMSLESYTEAVEILDKAKKSEQLSGVKVLRLTEEGLDNPDRIVLVIKFKIEA